MCITFSALSYLVHAGIEELPVANMQQPANTRLIRSLDTTFVEKLKEKITKDPSGPGVAPVAVLCTEIDEFEPRLKDVYKYEVLGGSTARMQLHREHPSNPLFSHILAEIYVGLSDDVSLRLASRHNVNGPQPSLSTTKLSHPRKGLDHFNHFYQEPN